jgi:uncharacterized protein
MHNLKYTLITGASEGLGKYLALECAARKMNLVLVALPQSGLKNLSKYIEHQYDVKVFFIEADISDKEGCEEVYTAVKKQRIIINILINNAGIGGTFSFEERSIEYYNKVINLNVLAPTLLCRLFFNELHGETPSFILNVSSLAGLFRLPKKQVYGASKSYLIAFSNNLKQELKNNNLHVSVLCPGGMDTSWFLTLQNHSTGTWLSRKSIMHPKEVAEIAIAKMLQGKTFIVPGVWNRLFVIFNKLIPASLKQVLSNYHIQTSKNKIMSLDFLNHAA